MSWGLAALLISLWLLAVLFFRANRIWLPYYLLGSVGLAFVIIFVGRATPVEELMEIGVAYATYGVANALQVDAQVFQAAPGALMLFVVGQVVGHDRGWTMVQVTIECSSLLETGVIAGMVGFYPAWPMGKRLALVLAGVVATFAANIVRLTVIIGALHWFGKDSLFLSHTVIGRWVFFVLVVAIFWYIITRPTLGTVRCKLERELAQ